jgi:membrane associated rhomboid family serine protease
MKISYNSPVILTFALICTALLGLNYIFENLIGNYFTLVPQFQFDSVTSYLRLFTYIFGHADWTHLISNFAFILLLGPILEEKYGKRDLITMMGITAIATAVLYLILVAIGLFDRDGLLGASGIVFMMILLSSMSNLKAGTIPLTFILIVILYVGREIYNSFQPDNISQFGHIFGGICGSIFGFARRK